MENNLIRDTIAKIVQQRYGLRYMLRSQAERDRYDSYEAELNRLVQLVQQGCKNNE